MLKEPTVILSACRTPIGSFGGSLKDVPASRLGAIVIRDGDSVLGAAGASGASGEDDRACVEAGLRAVIPGWTPS